MTVRSRTDTEVEELKELVMSLSTSISDDIIICDFNSEYTELLEKLGGQRVTIEESAMINAALPKNGIGGFLHYSHFLKSNNSSHSKNKQQNKRKRGHFKMKNFQYTQKEGYDHE